MKRILLVSSGLIHPPFLGRVYLRRGLSQLKNFSYRIVRSLEYLPENISQFSALVLYFHHDNISTRGLDTLDAYVRSGGGVLALHSATASFKESQLYFEILGGRFTGHGAVEPFEVTPVPSSPIFTGAPAFTVTDELYLHENQPGIEVHFTARYQGAEVPMVWTHRYGQGRVCYASPGHRAATMRDPVYQQVIRRGLAWAAHG